MRGRLKKIIAVLTVLLIAVVAGWLAAGYYLEGREIFARLPFVSPKTDIGTGTGERPGGGVAQDLVLKVYLPAEGGLREEERRIPPEALAVRLAEYLVREYLKALPAGLSNAKLLGIYKDRDNVLYVDLSDDFRRNFSGDARQEFFLLKSLYDTLSRNIPVVQDVVILSEGRQVESIGGHFSVMKPLKATFGEGFHQ